LTKEKNAPTSLAISMAMRIRRYGAERIAQYGRSRTTLDATGRQDWASIHPRPHRCHCHCHQFRRKKSSCGVVKSIFEAIVQKARNRLSTQLIEVTSCVERSNNMIKAEEHS
jgi:thiamine kinase-like enzyme